METIYQAIPHARHAILEKPCKMKRNLYSVFHVFQGVKCNLNFYQEQWRYHTTSCIACQCNVHSLLGELLFPYETAAVHRLPGLQALPNWTDIQFDSL